MSLPPFNETAVCPKCGYGLVNCQWRSRSGVYRDKAPAEDWISRRCERCGYIWDESCLSTLEGDKS